MPKTCGLDLEAIEKRCEAATEGPWVGDDGHVHSEPLSNKAHEWVMLKMEKKVPDFQRPEHEVCYCSQELPNFEDDEEFIAHSREDIPLLIAEVKRLRKSEAALRVAREALENICKHMETVATGSPRLSAVEAMARQAITKINSILDGDED